MSELTINDGVTELGVTTFDGEKAQVSSRKIADVFGKRHSNVIRDIENSIDKCSSEFAKLNFELSSYKAGTREYKEYLLTKDGCVFIIMGFTGEKAAKFKEAYIEQFNKMEELIKKRHITKIEYKPMTDAIKEVREQQGKEVNYFHFSNEADMLNLIVTGKKAKQIREKNDLEKGTSIRDYIPEWQVKAIIHLQRLNTDLIYSGLDYTARKCLLENRFEQMYDSLKLTTKEE